MSACSAKMGYSIRPPILPKPVTLKFKPVRNGERLHGHGGARRQVLSDWKSNHLGYRWDGTMDREALKLRWSAISIPSNTFYTVALNRYLSLRVRDYDYATHFGGVMYIFLRGVSADKGEEFGFFRHATG